MLDAALTPAPALAAPALSFHELVRRRKSCRQFLPEPVAPDLIRQVLDDAQQAPSNCNT